MTPFREALQTSARRGTGAGGSSTFGSSAVAGCARCCRISPTARGTMRDPHAPMAVMVTSGSSRLPINGKAVSDSAMAIADCTGLPRASSFAAEHGVDAGLSPWGVIARMYRREGPMPGTFAWESELRLRRPRC
jgi:hypothetical protein